MNKPMRLLILAMHAPNQAPGQRFRFEQYLDALRARGVDVHFSGLVDAQSARILYSPGNILRKAALTLRSILVRLIQIPSFRTYDTIFVQRQALFVGGPFIERLARAFRARLIYDFDDAVWINDASTFNSRFGWLKNTSKVPRIIAMSNLVIAGNRYLADFALQRNSNVVIVPTTIDTDTYVPRMTPQGDGPVTIGWSGSFSTIEHFKTVVPVLRRIQSKYGDRVRFRVIGDGSYRNEELAISGIPWNAATEIEDLRTIDIGLMPLPNDEWVRGKCGLKGLQYMALGIPTVMSPVGVNGEIIQHGKNGFLAGRDDEWVEVLSTLIEDPVLRADIGAAGRHRVVEAYSVNAWREKFCDLVIEVGNGR
jgi:glycosyltransferase involved in cell wall biosynthesis